MAAARAGARAGACPPAEGLGFPSQPSSCGTGTKSATRYGNARAAWCSPVSIVGLTDFGAGIGLTGNGALTGVGWADAMAVVTFAK